MLALPGAHAFRSALAVSREVHVFGRGLARLECLDGDALYCLAPRVTLDGLAFSGPRHGVVVYRGGLRIQRCALTARGFAIKVFRRGEDGGGVATVHPLISGARDIAV